MPPTTPEHDPVVQQREKYEDDFISFLSDEGVELDQSMISGGGEIYDVHPKWVSHLHHIFNAHYDGPLQMELSSDLHTRRWYSSDVKYIAGPDELDEQQAARRIRDGEVAKKGTSVPPMIAGEIAESVSQEESSGISKYMPMFHVEDNRLHEVRLIAFRMASTYPHVRAYVHDVKLDATHGYFVSADDLCPDQATAINRNRQQLVDRCVELKQEIKKLSEEHDQIAQFLSLHPSGITKHSL